MNTDQLITAAINQTLRNELPMVILTPDKHVIYANQPFADALGYTTEELVQLSHPDLCFSTFTEHPYYQTFWQQLLTGHAMQERTLRKAKDGHKVFFETTYTPYYDENGMITAIVNVSFNFNERAAELNQVFQTIKGFTDQINDIANNGTKQISDTITDVTKTQAFTTKNKVTSDTLLRETEQANDIITVIQDVAHQTRMLAVNSAIEAARLNEHGGSFTVISKEIRTLSNQVREEAVRIQERISKIEEQVKLMANEANQIHNLNANSADNLAINLKFYDDLKIGAEKIDAIYQQVGHLFDKQEA